MTASTERKTSSAIALFVAGVANSLPSRKGRQSATSTRFCVSVIAAASGLDSSNFNPSPEATTNAAALSKVLYTDYLLLFQMSGIVLLVAMMGAIVLTHRDRSGVKRQRIGDQVARSRNSVELKKVPTGKGV